MIIEVKEIIEIDSIGTIREKFPRIESFTESELEETIISEPQEIITRVAKKAARIDPRYFVLLKTNDNLLALHLALNYFLIITEDKIKRIEVCLGEQHAQEKFIFYVKQVAITWDISKKYFESEPEKITFEFCQRIVPKLAEHGFSIELIHTK